jgi:Na+/proline symporter
MTGLRRTLVVAEMQGRDLLRRRAVMTLFVLLPAAFYYSVPASEDYGLIAGSMGVSWAVAAAGMFGILGWRRADPRLALAGAPAHQGLLGRLLLLLLGARPRRGVRTADPVAVERAHRRPPDGGPGRWP